MHNLFKLKQALLALTIVLTPTLIYGQTQSGTLDPSFGSGGKAINDFGGRIALLPDGKIVAAGGASAADGFDFSLSRFNTNGTPDTTFGSGGRVTTDLGGRFEGATSIVVQPDGKIVTGGYAVVPLNQFANFALVRYNSDGSLDLSFGTGGKVITNFGNISAQAYSMALQPDGKIVLAGYVNFNGGESFALARYNTDGTLDAGFGTGGKVHTEFNAVGQTFSLASANSVALQQDGKIVAAGESTINGQRDFALARYNSNGTLDPGFGTGGKVNTDFVGFDDLANAVTIQPDGRIVAAGAAATGTAASVLFNFALARYNSNGTLDPTFGTGGKVTTDFAGASDTAADVVVQPDGKIIAAGTATINGFTDGVFGLVRYFSNGTLDPSFGTGGKLTTNFGPGSDGAGEVVLQQDGKILAAGFAEINGNEKSAMVRYLNDNSSPIPTPTPTPTPTATPTPTPTPAPTPAPSQTAWVEDGLPAGAMVGADNDVWNWIGSSPGPFSGSLAHQSSVSGGMHQHYFYGASDTLTIRAGDTLYAYVFIDAANPPSEIMLQWNSTSQGWNHRAYWGSDLIGLGTNGTGSRRSMGALPAAGQWVRLEVPASQVGLEGLTVSGMAFTLYNGRATWDHAGSSSNQTPSPTPTPLPTPTPTPTPAPTPAPSQTAWVEDGLPAGATPAADNDDWNWISSNPAPVFGNLAHQSRISGGMHQHYFYGASDTLTIRAGDTLYAYVFIDAANPPSEIMLQWNSTSQGWNHRAYWGSDLIGFGTNGTGSRRSMGALPAGGQWVRLEVPASQVGLEGLTVSGMAFTLYDGRATWDHAGR